MQWPSWTLPSTPSNLNWFCQRSAHRPPRPHDNWSWLRPIFENSPNLGKFPPYNDTTSLGRSCSIPPQNCPHIEVSAKWKPQNRPQVEVFSKSICHLVWYSYMSNLKSAAGTLKLQVNEWTFGQLVTKAGGKSNVQFAVSGFVLMNLTNTETSRFVWIKCPLYCVGICSYNS